MNTLPANLVWIYTSFQPIYEELSKTNKNIKFVKGLPDSFEDFQDALVVLDDVIFQASDHPEVVKIFTQYRHHKTMSVMMLTQNAFHSNYMVLFKNPRDKLQIEILARQIFPSQKTFFSDSFKDATEEPHGYLILDLTPSCPERYIVRAGLLPGQYPVIYLPKSK